MENSRQFKLKLKAQTLLIHNQPFPQPCEDYFRLYPCQQSGVVLISSFKTHTDSAVYRAIKNAEKHWGGFNEKSMGCQIEMGTTIMNGQNCYYFAFPTLKISSCLANSYKWLGNDKMLQLAEVFFKKIKQIEQKSLYYGSFRITRIFQTPEGQFIFLPGFLTSQQTGSQDYLQKYPTLEPSIQNQWKYQPPEIYLGPDEQLNYKSDLFVASCILFEIMTGFYPFNNKNELLSSNKFCPTTNSSEFSNLLFDTILKVPNQNRPAPTELLERLQAERSKVLFSTNLHHNLVLQEDKGEKSTTLSLFDNIQQFFVKCVKETEGWFLYYCQNTPDAPDSKYLELILKKMALKKQKIEKIIPMIEKYATMKIKTCSGMSKSSIFGKQQSQAEEIYEYSVIKLGIFILNVLRKASSWPQLLGSTELQKIKNHARKVVEKKPADEFISTIYKVIVFKLTLQSNYPTLKGNFNISVQSFIETINFEALNVLSEYCLKLVGYLGRLTSRIDKQNLNLLESTVLLLLCEELYDAFSVVIFSSKSLQKDHQNQSKQMEESFDKVFENVKKTLQKIEKLCLQSEEISHHRLYSIETDPYSYQEKLQILYVPIFTSYEYFYYDNNTYKGLQLPKDFCKQYGIQCQQELPGLQNRKFVSHRKQSILNQKNNKTKSNTNEYPQVFSQNKQTNLNSEGSKVAAKTVKINAQEAIKTEKAISQDNFLNDFMDFSTSQHKKSKDSCATNVNSSSNSMSESMVSQKTIQEEFQQTFSMENIDEIYNYEWLKRTEKIMIEKKLFVKPQIDAKIHMLYEEIVKGLKLQQLIETLEKNKKMIVDPNQILFQKVIGSGSAGDVYIGKYQQRIVAIKKVKTSTNPNALKEFEREVLTYIKIKSHPNLVSMIGLTKFNEDYFLVTEFCDAGSLFQLLHKKVNQISLSWKVRVNLALDIALGMNVLHEMNPPVIHRDMKSLNVFITQKQDKSGWVAKVADFGLSRTPDAGMMTSALGTLHWMAPELLCNKQYSLKVDVYSFGVVLWEICSRRTPYHNQTTPMAIVKHVVMEKGRPLKQLINEGCPSSLMALMEKCWAEDSQQRPYFPQIISTLQKATL